MLTTGKPNRDGNRGSPPGGRGFTLVELLLVMTTLIVVISISLPMLTRFFRGRTLDEEARRLLSLTRYGQSRAVSEGIPMVLWVDAKKQIYGLEQEAGYSDLDTKAVQFMLEKDLTIRVINNNNVNPVLVANENARARRMLAQSPRQNLPTIRFQPDGFMSETSPQALQLQGRDGESLNVAQARNRLTYEITSQLSLWNGITR